MPLVNISILSGKSPEYIKAVGDGINSAVIETMGFPPDDRYQIIHQLDSEQLQLQGRDGDRVMMHLVMRAGRSNESKQAFYKKVVENLAVNPGIPPENVMITLSENHDIDWSFRDGVAQFMVYPDADISKHKPTTETATPTVTTTSGTLVAKPYGQPKELLLQDYLIGVVVLALVGLVFWSIRQSGKE
ncbi:MAG: tautomerase family protein [Methylobacter sp.]|uniref:Tautomerase family protein n=1 Tax=Candidatus Methylobacter titanis TaxID=3053457 RepID=A0AA43Q511_9GAMM|nr:tautomerase family protein [Candidatus Methylobacter titanis]MDI1291152.1 tautomerase family protein [Candidatus Methylobacter titanis]